MSVHRSSARLGRLAHHMSSRSDICLCFESLSLQSRSLSSSARQHATPSLHPTTTKENASRGQSTAAKPQLENTGRAEPAHLQMSPAQRAARAAERARERLQEQQKKFTAGSRQLGGLAKSSPFAPVDTSVSESTDQSVSRTPDTESLLSARTLDNMSFALNPKPNARERWQRKMLIRHIRRRGRLNRETQIARTERNHLSKSHFFKTSVKKLAPLARQIAGKSIDEAILQMRFSKKKAAIEVRAHLIQARNEAVVVKGMGLGGPTPPIEKTDSPVVLDPAITPPLPHQNPIKSIKAGFEKASTDMYVAEAWVNRGPYGMEPEFRARGRVNTLRPPSTGISVLLKEETTRTREKVEKEVKAIKKRMGKNMWVQMPDRPITRQSQHVLW